MDTQKQTIGAIRVIDLQVNAITIIDLQGRLDAHQSKDVDKILMAHLEKGSQTIVNLQNVHFIDSTGLATLVRAIKRHREQKGELLLCALQQPVQIIFELTRLDRVFDIYPTEAEAIAAIELQQRVPA